MPLHHLIGGLAAGALCLALAAHAAATPHIDTAGPQISLTLHSETRADHREPACWSGATDTRCEGIDLFEDAVLSPGASHTTVVVIRNTGRSTLRGLDLVADSCKSGNATAAPGPSLCSAIRLRVTTTTALGVTTTPVRGVALEDLSRAPVHLTPPATPGELETVRLTLTLDPALPLALQGAAVSQPLSWHATV